MTQFIVEVVKTSKKKQKSVLAQNIIAGRDSMGLTAEKFAEEAKIPYPTLRDIEADLSGGRPATLEKIARTLKVEPWQLKKPGLFFVKKGENMAQSPYASNDDNGTREVISGLGPQEKLFGDPIKYPRNNESQGSSQLNHKPISSPNKENFSPDEAQLILAIQSVLTSLNHDQLRSLHKYAVTLNAMNVDSSQRADLNLKTDKQSK